MVTASTSLNICHIKTPILQDSKANKAPDLYESIRPQQPNCYQDDPEDGQMVLYPAIPAGLSVFRPVTVVERTSICVLLG